ncbi:MAG: signal recognition particle-docking protein FtsY [Lachnospira sp.]|nr:signal recognition particle-docking protein FtsY [Lachnospira sp.]
MKKDKDNVEETSSIQPEEEREDTEEYKENGITPGTQDEDIPNPKDDDTLGKNEPEEEKAEDKDISEADVLQEDVIDAGEENVPVLDEEEDSEAQSDSKKKGFFGRLVSGLTKTRNSIADSFSSVFAANHIDEDFYEELEEILIMADMGVSTTMNILDELRDEVKKQHIKEPKDCQELLVSIIKNQMSLEENAYDYEQKKSVVMVIGVNGVGKTTSIGKLASQFRKNGKKVMMAAADTFRAAAIEQLTEWANRSQVDIISQKEGADPSAVVFDALKAAKARKTDILLIDTAGRLHNKKNLMDELSKMNRIIDREYPDACRETLIVLDGTTGQNALEQAKQFKQVADIDGIILTKLDGTAKGGIAIAIHAELGVPVKYIGVGEGIDDLQKFDPESYVNAIFAKEGDVEEE